MIRQVMDTDVSEVPQGSQLVKYSLCAQESSQVRERK